MGMPTDTTGDSDELIHKAQYLFRDERENDKSLMVSELVARIRQLEQDKYEAIRTAWEESCGEDL